MGKKRGRPPALTAAKHTEIVTALKAGVPKSTAVRAARVDISTYCRWMRKGELIANGRKEAKDDSDVAYHQFYLDVKAAENECERMLVGKLMQSVLEHGDIPTAKWMLERRYSKNWVLRTHIGVSGSATEDAEDAPIEFVLATPKIVPPANTFGTEDEDGQGRSGNDGGKDGTTGEP